MPGGRGGKGISFREERRPPLPPPPPPLPVTRGGFWPVEGSDGGEDVTAVWPIPPLPGTHRPANRFSCCGESGNIPLLVEDVVVVVVLLFVLVLLLFSLSCS